MMNVQNQCCQFFKILIKKELMFFLQIVVRVLCGWGVPMYKLKKLCTIQKIKSKKKAIYNWKKIKTKNDYVQLQMKVFQFHA